MQGQGNDFVVINAIAQHVTLTAQQISALADRHFGIGCDQLLLVEKSTTVDADFRYRIFNADGGEVEQCGNGARCFAKFVRDQGLSDQVQFRVETMAGIIAPRVNADGSVTVNMGAPRFALADIPFTAAGIASCYALDIDGKSVDIGALSMGNPHAVQVVADIDTAPVTTDGPLIENHVRFPSRVNAGFMQIISRKQVKLRVWERGAGETLACGTGACAAVVTGINWGLLDNQVTVSTQGGDLSIHWDGNAGPVLMSGDAVSVFHGEIDL